MSTFIHLCLCVCTPHGCDSARPRVRKTCRNDANRVHCVRIKASGTCRSAPSFNDAGVDIVECPHCCVVRRATAPARHPKWKRRKLQMAIPGYKRKSHNNRNPADTCPNKLAVLTNPPRVAKKSDVWLRNLVAPKAPPGKLILEGGPHVRRCGKTGPPHTCCCCAARAQLTVPPPP